jgi:hypothetical protein
MPPPPQPPTDRPQKRRRVARPVPHLPEDLLCHVLQFVNCAPTLALLREVAPSWRAVVDGNPKLWAHASFKNTFFARPIIEVRTPLPAAFTSAEPDTFSLLSASSTLACWSCSTSCLQDQSSPSQHYDPATASITLKPRPSRANSWVHEMATPTLLPPLPLPYPFQSLALGPRPGLVPLSRAASAGNEWAAFLIDTFFKNRSLYAISLPHSLACALASGRLHTLRPPLLSQNQPNTSRTITSALAASVVAAVAANINLASSTRKTPAPAPPNTGWLAVHSARAQERRKGGALVGVVRVVGTGLRDGRWTVLRAVLLDRPIRCGGYGGMWEMSECLTDLLVRALHSQ